MTYRDSHLQRGGTYDENLASDPFSAYMTTLEHELVPGMVKQAFPQGIGRYLDFACGTGRMTQVIAPFAREAHGLDISPSMLEQAKRKLPNVNFKIGDITKESIELGEFDLISSFRFFGNAEHALRREVFKQLAARIKPGGHLLINSHRNPHSLAMRLMAATGGEHGMDLHWGKLTATLNEFGLEVVARRPIGVWLFRGKLLGTCNIARPFDRSMENLFSAGMFAPIAPDTLVLARKTRAA